MMSDDVSIQLLPVPYTGPLVPVMAEKSGDNYIPSQEFQKTGVLGYGCDGVVLLAQHTDTEARVATTVVLKLFRTVRKFSDEHEKLALCQHTFLKPVIGCYGVTVLNACIEGCSYFLCTIVEEAASSDLYTHHQRHGPYTNDAFIMVARQVARALKVLHQKGVAHCDLKMENLLVHSHAITGAIKSITLGDLGHSVYAHQTLSYGGTYGYMPPEMIHHVAERTALGGDFFSLGVLYTVMKCAPDQKNDIEEIAAAGANHHGNGQDMVDALDVLDSESPALTELIAGLLNPENRRIKTFEEIFAYLNRMEAEAEGTAHDSDSDHYELARPQHRAHVIHSTPPASPVDSIASRISSIAITDTTPTTTVTSTRDETPGSSLPSQASPRVSTRHQPETPTRRSERRAANSPYSASITTPQRRGRAATTGGRRTAAVPDLVSKHIRRTVQESPTSSHSAILDLLRNHGVDTEDPSVRRRVSQYQHNCRSLLEQAERRRLGAEAQAKRTLQKKRDHQ